MQQKQIIVTIALLIIVGGGAFYGGMKYGQSTAPGGRGQFQDRGGPNGGGGNFARRGGPGGGFVNGEVIGKDDKSLTVKMRDGSTKIVFFSGSTNIGRTVDGTAADISVGQMVMVNGPANSDGSVTAQFIQIRPTALPGQAPGQPQSGALENTPPSATPVPQ